MSDAADRLLAVADELYGLPLGEFTTERDRHAAELRSTDRDLAAAVKGLRKPSVAAWAVNLLVRRETEQVAQVLAVGAALREAQQEMDATELRALTVQRRQLTAAVTTRARALARGEGQRLSESVAAAVEATLTAAMLDEGAARAVQSGLLVAALAATGVEAVEVAPSLAVPEALGFTASAAPAPAPQETGGRPELSVVPDPDADRKRLEAAEEDERRALAEVEESRTALGATERRLSELQARTIEIQAGIDELRRRIAGLEEEADEVDEEVAATEEEQEETRAAVTAAEAEAERATSVVRRLRQALGG